MSIHHDPDPVRVHIVDDDDAVRESLSFLLESVQLRGQAWPSADAFLNAYDGGPGVLVLDVRMPGMSGVELQEELNRRGIDQLAILFISGHGDIPMAVEALKRGARDFITKPFRDQELLDRIHEALSEQAARSSQRADRQQIMGRLKSLSNREMEVLRMVSDGKANKVIASDLGISQRTVEIHRARVMEKMEVRTLAMLIRDLNQIAFFESDFAIEPDSA